MSLKIFAVFLWAILAAIFLPAANAQEVWVRTGHFYYSNGTTRNPKGMDSHGFSSTTTGGKANEITWSEPPERVTEGQTVVLTIQSSKNEGCPVAAHWALSGCGEGSATGDGSAGSYKGYKGDGTFNAGSITFVFKATGAEPTMSVVGGRADDASGTMSGMVYWIYVTEADFQKMTTKPNPKLEPVISIEGEESKALAYTTDPVAVTVRTEPDATVELFFDDKPVASGQVNAERQAKLKMTLPTDIPSGATTHKFRVVARKPGLENGEDTHALEIKRGLIPITVEASPSVRRAKKDDMIEVTGLVYVHHPKMFNHPVKAEIRVLDDPLSKTTTDDNGFFKMQVPVKSDKGENWKLEATPIENTRYDKGSAKIEIESFKDGDLEISIFSDKAVYAPTGEIYITGSVTSAGKPVEGKVRVAAVSRQEENPTFIADVKTDAKGRYGHTFPVSALSRIKTPSSALEGQTSILVAASAKGFGNSDITRTHVVIQNENAESGLQEFMVTKVSGQPSLSQTEGPDLVKTTLKMGTRLTQGAVITTGRGEKVTLVMPFPNGGFVQITVKPNSTIRVFRFFKDTDGRVKLHINAEESDFNVKTKLPGGAKAPLDYVIMTANGMITSIETSYNVRVDKNGVTRVEGEEGEAIVTPLNPAEKPSTVGPGQTVQVPANAVFGAETPAVPPTSTGKEVTLEIPANKAWTGTGITLNAGDYARIEASGAIEASNSSDPRAFFHKVPPEGRDEFLAPMPQPALRPLGLIGKIGSGSPAVPIRSYTHKLTAGSPYGTGELFLGINDDNVSDNSGAWNVRITVFPKPTPPPVTPSVTEKGITGFPKPTPPPVTPSVTEKGITGFLKPTPPPVTPSVTEKTIDLEIPANKSWTATGVTVDANTYIRIQASGVVEASKPSDSRAFYHSVPPDGRDEFISAEPEPSLHALSLIGKLGNGAVLPICKYVHKLQAGSPYGSGQLFLGINDDVVSDNSGAWKVRITTITSKP